MNNNETIIINQKYQSFKELLIGITGIARHLEVLKNMVIYKHLGSDKFEARPEKIFLESDAVS